jgi:hypothetical protein
VQDVRPAAITGGFFMPGNGRKEPNVEATTLLNCLKRRHHGKENAVRSPVLEARFGVTGAALRSAVNSLRCAEHPICSDENGYYYASDGAELEATVRQLTSRISQMAKAKNGLVHALGKYSDGGQTRLPL